MCGDIRRHKFGERRRRTEDEVVGEHHGKWLMTNGVSCHEHSVAESELLFLTNRHKVHHVGNRSHGAKVLNITALLKDRLKVGRNVEVILDRALVFAGDEDDPLNP